MVEKFQAHDLSNIPSSSHKPIRDEVARKWIRISPKKRGRSFPPSHEPKPLASASVGIRISEPSPVLSPLLARVSKVGEGKGKGKTVLQEVEFGHCALGPASFSHHILTKVDSDGQVIVSCWVTPTVILLINDSSIPMILIPSPMFVLCTNDLFCSPVHPCDGEDDMEQDGDEDYFLELDDLVDSMVFTESLKKRKLEEGEECSSRCPP